MSYFFTTPVDIDVVLEDTDDRQMVDVKLDKNRNAIADIFVTEVTEGANGDLLNKVVSIAKDVNETLGEPEADFVKRGAASRDNPDCK